VAKQWIKETVTGEGVQITLVQLAPQTRITCQASKIGVNCIFVPSDMLFAIGIYRNTGEVSNCTERDLPLWDDDPSRQKRLFRVVGPRAQDKFVSQAEHRPARLSLVNNVTGHASTLELPIRVDKK
jgi:hypothetical protein